MTTQSRMLSRSSDHNRECPCVMSVVNEGAIPSSCAVKGVLVLPPRCARPVGGKVGKCLDVRSQSCSLNDREEARKISKRD